MSIWISPFLWDCWSPSLSQKNGEIQIDIQGNGADRKADFPSTDAFHDVLRQLLKEGRDIEGLEVPSLENVAAWIWRRLDKAIPGLDRVMVRRGMDGAGEGCSYSGRQLKEAASSRQSIRSGPQGWQTRQWTTR